jgi:hypothetical protein
MTVLFFLMMLMGSCKQNAPSPQAPSQGDCGEDCPGDKQDPKKFSAKESASSKGDGSTDEDFDKTLNNLLGGGKGQENPESPDKPNSPPPAGGSPVTDAARFAAPYRTPYLNLTGQDLPYLLLGKDPNDHFYHCPDQSFVVGMESTYDMDGEDRAFRLMCGFFETMDGENIIKKSCTLESAPYNTPKESLSQFQCPEGRYLAGIRGTYDGEAKDRLLFFECCQIGAKVGQIEKSLGKEGSPENISCTQRVNQERGSLAEALYPLINDEVNPYQQPFRFQCPANTILSTIRSSYFDGKSDRRYSFRCCPMVQK